MAIPIYSTPSVQVSVELTVGDVGLLLSQGVVLNDKGNSRSSLSIRGHFCLISR